MLFVQLVPLWLLPSTLVSELAVDCYVHLNKKERDVCKPPTPAAATAAPGAAPVAPPPAQPKGADSKAKAQAQVRAAELKARAEYGVATAILLIVSLGAAVFALGQLRTSSQNASSDDRKFVIGAATLAVALAAIAAWHDWRNEDFGHALINAIFVAGTTAKSLLDAGKTGFSNFIGLNLLFAYVGAALLLVYLASLTIPDWQKANAKSGLVGLQFGVVIGAAIFALGGYTNKTGVAWAAVALEEGAGTPLIDLTKTVLDLWSVSSSAFIFTAIATAYWGIRQSPRKSDPATSTALVARGEDGDDFKALGWIVQLLIALAPIWLPASLGKFLETAKMLPGTG